MLGHPDPVDRVVGGHDQHGSGLAHAGLEGGQVELAQHVLRDARVVGPALGFRVVADVMLDRRRNARGLQAADVRHRDAGGQHRILGEALESAPAERRAHQVDRRREQHVDALAPGLRAQRGGHLMHQPGVPGGAKGGRAGQAGGREALVLDDAACPGRAVRCGHRPKAQGRGALSPPAVGAGQQEHLLRDGKLGQQAVLVRRIGARVGVE